MELYQLYYLIPFVVALLAQWLKLIIDFTRGHGLHIKSLFVSWWMPSAHSTLTSSLLVVVLVMEGWLTELSMITAAFAWLVWYDAANVRYQSWKHAKYINSLRSEMFVMMSWDVSHWEEFLLKERLWHTPLEVIVGILFGASASLGCMLLLDTYVVHII